MMVDEREIFLKNLLCVHWFSDPMSMRTYFAGIIDEALTRLIGAAE